MYLLAQEEIKWSKWPATINCLIMCVCCIQMLCCIIFCFRFANTSADGLYWDPFNVRLVLTGFDKGTKNDIHTTSGKPPNDVHFKGKIRCSRNRKLNSIPPGLGGGSFLITTASGCIYRRTSVNFCTENTYLLWRFALFLYKQL